MRHLDGMTSHPSNIRRMDKAVGKVIVCFLSRFVILAYFPHLDVGGSPEEFAEVGEGGRSAAGRKRHGQSL